MIVIHRDFNCYSTKAVVRCSREVPVNTQKMIQVLLTAIDSGSLTKAGEILGYTQSNLTQMMRSFEDEVGFPLLIKTKKGVEPTREALQLLPTMRAMRAQEEKFFQEISDLRGIKRGTIRIGTFVSTSTSWLPQLLSYFQEHHPDVVFEIVESGQDEMERGVADGSLDIALLSEPETTSIEFIPLIEDPMLVVFSDKHDLSRYDYVPVDALKDYPMVMTYQTYDRDVRKVFDQAGYKPDVRYYFRDDFAVLSMVQYGLGIAVLPELIIEKHPGSYDTRMLDPESYRNLGIGIRTIKDAGPLTRSVISYLKDTVINHVSPLQSNV